MAALPARRASAGAGAGANAQQHAPPQPERPAIQPAPCARRQQAWPLQQPAAAAENMASTGAA